MSYFCCYFFNIWPFSYWTLNTWSLETWSCVCCYCACGLFLCFRSLWNIPKNARKLGVGRGQFDVGVNGLSYKESIAITWQSTQLKMKCILYFIAYYRWPKNFICEKISERIRLFMNYSYHEKLLFLFNYADLYICWSIVGFVFRAIEKRPNHTN